MTSPNRFPEFDELAIRQQAAELRGRILRQAFLRTWARLRQHVASHRTTNRSKTTGRAAHGAA